MWRKRSETKFGLKSNCGVFGTFILVFFGGMAALLSGAEATKGLYAGVLAVGLTFGLALALAIHIFGKISGGHYNPAVTTALLATRRIALNDALVYYVRRSRARRWQH